MKYCIVMLSIAVFFIAADQTAITDDGINIILKDDGTWALADTIEGEFEQLTVARTENNRRVVLLPGRWYYIVDEPQTQQADEKDLFPQIETGKRSKSVATGYALSICATVVPISFASVGIIFPGCEVLAVGGVMVGPSVGHFYAGQWGRGLLTSSIRIGAAGGGILLAVTLMDNLEDYDTFFTVMIPASCIVFGTAIYDIFSVPHSVLKYNRQHSLMLQPEIDLKEKRYGVGIVYRF